MPYRGQYKLSGTYPLPYGVSVSGSFRSEPGGGGGANGADSSQNNNYSISKAIFKTATGQTLTQTSVLVQLLQPGTVYLPAINTVDVRLSKKVQMGKATCAGAARHLQRLQREPCDGLHADVRGELSECQQHSVGAHPANRRDPDVLAAS